MPELRKDSILKRWVIVSSDDVKGPKDFTNEKISQSTAFCFFCSGNEDKTTKEILAYKENTSTGTSNWSLRVIPNRFPVLQAEGSVDPRGEGMFDLCSGVGAHEIVIETPEHNKSLSSFSTKDIENVLGAYLSRIRDLKNDLRFQYVIIFKNHGLPAGASLEHSHSQIVALPVLPKMVMEEVEGARAYYAFKNRCVYCDIINQERDLGIRVINESKDFMVFSPFASRFPFEMWIIPKFHDTYFGNMCGEEVVDLAKVLKDALLRMDIALDNPSYNYVIHTGPFRENSDVSYHWHIEIMPKLTKVSGFEWGTGFYINPTPPENAARILRNIKI